MRYILGALALVVAVPAQAQYMISISGSGVYDASQDAGDVTDVLANYGTSITFSSTLVIDAGVRHSDPFAIDYSGYTTAMTLNGNAVTLIGPSPFAVAPMADNAGNPQVSFWTENMTEPRGTDNGLVFGIITFTPASLGTGEITNDFATYPMNSPFNFVALGGSAGIARYTFTLGSFSVTGTQPTLTPYVPPVDPNDPGAVPEPAAWAMMLGGFGLVGGMMRRRLARIAYS